MKVAVLNSDGIQSTVVDRLRKYYIVPDTYDFVVNNAFDVITDPTNGTGQLSDILELKSVGRRCLAINGVTESEVGLGDYKVFRTSLMIYVATLGFYNLTESEKKVASEHFTVSSTDRDTVHTLDEQITNGITYHIKSSESRRIRILMSEAEMYSRLISSDMEEVSNEVKNNSIHGDLQSLYINHGREGTLEGDTEGLFDYVESRSGTNFDGVGLKDKSYTVKGMTGTSELSTQIINILKNGKYK